MDTILLLTITSKYMNIIYIIILNVYYKAEIYAWLQSFFLHNGDVCRGVFKTQKISSANRTEEAKVNSVTMCESL